MVASWLLWSDRVDEVWLVPTYDHPFSKELIPFTDRLALVRTLAESVDSRVVVSEVERELPQPSYSLQTLRHLQKLHKEHSFHLVVGADVLLEVDAWHRWDLIMSEFPPIIVGRVGYEPVERAPQFPQISSTEIRSLLAAGKDVSHLVASASVKSVVGLYGAIG
jgi:nicotinate-nucleotide adenylyltransferase